MKRHTAAKCILIIITLLIVQVGNAFTGAPFAQACNMDMSSDLAGDKVATALHQVIVDTPDSNGANSSMMECCDMPMPASCCDADCQCVALLVSLVFLNNEDIKQHRSYTSKLVAHPLSNPASPYLTKRKRPPITRLS